MGNKLKHYSISPKDDENTVYGSFHLADIKRLANALMGDIADEKSKSEERKAKKTLLKRLRKMLEEDV